MAIHTAEAHDIDVRIDEAAAATEALARQYFGEAAYLRRDIHDDRETGEEKAVFEVHYCFRDPENDFGRLAALHNEFINVFARDTSPDVVGHVVLMAIPSDAD